VHSLCRPSQSPEEHGKAIPGSQREHVPGRVHVIWRQLQREPLQHHGDHGLGLDHGEILADAGPRPSRERQQRVLGCLAAFVTPFSNLSGLNSPASSPPHLLVAMDRHDRDRQDRAPGHTEPAEVEARARLPVYLGHGSVQAQRLEEEHVDQFQLVEHVAGGDLVGALLREAFLAILGAC
jgi:hypothetical protein